MLFLLSHSYVGVNECFVKGGGLAPMWNKIKSALFLFGFRFLSFNRIPFETGRFFILFSTLFLLFAFWLLPVLLLQGFMQILGGFRHRRIWMSSADNSIYNHIIYR